MFIRYLYILFGEMFVSFCFLIRYFSLFSFIVVFWESFINSSYNFFVRLWFENIFFQNIGYFIIPFNRTLHTVQVFNFDKMQLFLFYRLCFLTYIGMLFLALDPKDFSNNSASWFLYNLCKRLYRIGINSLKFGRICQWNHLRVSFPFGQF